MEIKHEINENELLHFRSIESERRTATWPYYIIRAFFRAIAKTQHSEIQCIGLENIPPDGSVFLVGNHPNSFLDYFNLCTIVRHPIATAAKDTITSIPGLGYLMEKYAMMIPTARAQDRNETGQSTEERAKRNERMAESATNLLLRGRLFNIYAEGRSTDSRKLNKIKLGFMMLGIMAEKKTEFNLNLRIVPYGYYYDHINKFQSSVCVILGKPFKIRSLTEFPEDYSSLSDGERSSLDKKIMMSGKRKLQGDIEDIIINISDEKLIPLIDATTAIYVRTPAKYMGPYENVREKYVISRNLSRSIQAAAISNRGRRMLAALRRRIKLYQKKQALLHIFDAELRRDYSWRSWVVNLSRIVQGIVFFPLISYGYIANFFPRLCGRITRYWTIEKQGRARVDGDERAIIAAIVGAAFVYPIISALTFYAFRFLAVPAFVAIASASDKGWLGLFASGPAHHPLIASLTFSFVATYLNVRLWRTSLHYGGRLRDGLYFIRDGFISIFRRNRLIEMRSIRSEIIDLSDIIIGDYLR